MSGPRRRGTRTLVVLAVALLPALGLTACEDDEPDAARICVDQQHERVAADECSAGDRPATASSPFIWWYLLYGRPLPRIGAKAAGGTRSVAGSATVEEDERAPAGEAYSDGDHGAPVDDPGAPHENAPVEPVEPHVGGFR